MPKKDLDLLADELWWICKEHNGIPSQTVDKRAYSKALYCLKTYGDRPEIKAVIKEFNLTLPKKYSNHSDIKLDIEEIKKLLEERGRMPLCPEEEILYHKVRYFFKKNADNEEVKRLKRIYASGDCCPLYEKTPDSHLNRVQPYRRVLKSMQYVLDTYRMYHDFPARNTVPMKLVRYILENPSQQIEYRGFYMTIPLYEFNVFLTNLVELGCEDEMVINNWNKLNKTNEL